jgi:hypothetical protein
MGLLLATVLGLVIWIVLWATGSKAIDAIMPGMLIALVAFAGRLLAPHLPGNKAEE